MKQDAGEQFVGQGFIEKGAVGVGLPTGSFAKRKPKSTGVRCQSRVPALAQIDRATGPAISRRAVCQARTHWVEFNAAVAAKDVVSAVHNAVSLAY